MGVALNPEERAYIAQLESEGYTIIDTISIGSGKEKRAVVRPPGAYIGQEKQISLFAPERGRVVGGYFGDREPLPQDLAFKKSELEAQRQQELYQTGTMTTTQQRDTYREQALGLEWGEAELTVRGTTPPPYETYATETEVQAIDTRSKPRKYYETAIDAFSGATGGYIFESLGRPTATTVGEFKSDLKMMFFTALKVKKNQFTPTTPTIPSPSLLTFQYLGGLEAQKLRKSGRETIQTQQMQAGRIESVSGNLEDIEKAYGGRELSVTEYKEARRLTDTELRRLGQVGVSTKISGDDLIVSSPALDKTVAPMGLKIQKSFLSSEGKITYKNVAFTAATIGQAVGTGYVLGAVGSASGLIPYAGRLIKKAPLLGKVLTKYPNVSKVAGGGLVAGSVGYAGYVGYKSGDVLGIPKLGAVVGASSVAGELIGFGVGAKAGSKAYYETQKRLTRKGAFTQEKVFGEGKEIYKRGKFVSGTSKQSAISTTKVRGTDIKAVTTAETTGTYIPKGKGFSTIKATTRITTGKGRPTTVTSLGKTLETKGLVKLRVFTTTPKGKIFETDYLLQRKVLGTATKGTTTKVNILTAVRTTGREFKVAKIPKSVFTKTELKRFSIFSGERAITEPSLIKSKPLTKILKTEQFIKFGKTRPTATSFFVNGKKVKVESTLFSERSFASVSRTTGLPSETLTTFIKSPLKGVKFKFVLPTGKKGSAYFGTGGTVTTPPPTPTKGPRLTSILFQDQVKALTSTTINKQVSALVKPSKLSKYAPGVLLSPSSVTGVKSKTIQAAQFQTKGLNIQDMFKKSVTRPRTSTLPITSTLPATSTLSRTIPRTSLGVLSATMTSSITSTTSPVVLAPPSPSISTTRITRPRETPFIGLIDLPDRGYNLSSITPKTYQPQKQTAYFPSLSALIFDIRGDYKKSDLALSGLDFRPKLKDLKVRLKVQR